MQAEKADFRSHLRKYVNMYLPDCPFEVSTTNRYTITRFEAAITARKRIRGGDRINYLCGTLVPLTEEELSDLDLAQRNFSVVQSNRKKNTLIFLGPARFANHDCNANGRLVSVGKDGLEVHATRNIEIGEEITVTYSPGYFGSNNQDCLCHTCELLGRNGWNSAEGAAVTESGVSTPTSSTFPSMSPASRSKKRKVPPELGDSGSEQSSPSPKKLQLVRPPSRLSHVLTPPASFQSSDDDTPTQRTNGHNTFMNNGGGDSSMTNGEARAMDLDEKHSRAAHNPSHDAESLPKRRVRLIDQMTSSSNNPSPVVKNGRAPGPAFQTPDSEEVSVDVEAEASFHSPIKIKIESVEQSKVEHDHQQSLAAGKSHEKLDSMRTVPQGHPLSAKTTVKTTLTSISRARPSPILPSIETHLPSTDDLTTAAISTKTTLTSPTDGDPIARHPGDYILTRRLIAQPYDCWVQCQTCSAYFLQPNGYQIRRECPRCERHSILYGFEWPKTEPDPRRLRELAEIKDKEQKAARAKKQAGKRRSLPQSLKSTPSRATSSAGSGSLWGRGRGGGRSGRSGKGSWVEGGGEDEREERVLDHRTVNRFIAPEDDREIRRRAKEGLLEGGAQMLMTNGASPTPEGLAATIGARVGRGRASLGVLGLGQAVRGGGSGSASRDRDRESGSREESVASGLEGELRRSKRFFASRLTM